MDKREIETGQRIRKTGIRKTASDEECAALALDLLSSAEEQGLMVCPLSGEREFMGSTPQFTYRGRRYALAVVDIGPDI